MTPALEQVLTASGARMSDGSVLDFGDPAEELRTAASGSIVVPLTTLACLEFSGDDAETFLHGQLSCDVQGIAAAGACYGAYCSPQGRVLANFILLRLESSFLMLLSASVVETIKKRIGMFVLRSRVKISLGNQVLIGLSGNIGVQAGTKPLASSHEADGTIALKLDAGRSLLIIPPEIAHSRWQSLATSARPAGVASWEWLDICAGVPWIGAATREEFIPQMANLDLLGGVSFTKGCYPGQEVVARTQYRGQVKRRMFRAHVDAAILPKAGDPLFSDDLGDQASGKVVSAQPSPSGGYDLLAVVTISSMRASTIRLGSATGAALTFQTLPYPVA